MCRHTCVHRPSLTVGDGRILTRGETRGLRGLRGISGGNISGLGDSLLSQCRWLFWGKISGAGHRLIGHGTQGRQWAICIYISVLHVTPRLDEPIQASQGLSIRLCSDTLKAWWQWNLLCETGNQRRKWKAVIIRGFLLWLNADDSLMLCGGMWLSVLIRSKNKDEECANLKIIYIAYCGRLFF